jgi:hypothetical protein
VRRAIPLLFLFFCAAAALCGSARAQTPATGAFLSVIDDVPLMPGLTERTEAAVVFDKPEGRIVETEAAGRLSRAAVLKFYAASLPQLGWRARGDGRFLRDREELVLSFAGGGGGALVVRFTLSPDR